MKSTLVALALLCAGAAFAQTPPAPSAGAPPPPMSHAGGKGGMPSTHMDDIATLLDLTDAQRAQVAQVIQEEHAKMRATLQSAASQGALPDRQTMKTLHEQIQAETLQKLTPVLSATQLKKFQLLQQMMHSPHAHPGGEGPAGGAADAAPPPGHT